jgi:hypothetical protein
LNIVNLRQRTRPNIEHPPISHYTQFEDAENLKESMLELLVPELVCETRKHLQGAIETLANKLELCGHQFFGRRLLAEDTLFTLLVFSAPNLERLWVRMPRCYVWPKATCKLLQRISLAVLGVPWGKVHRFENLKTLYIDLVSIPE